MHETRGSAGSGETGRRRTNACWDTRDEKCAKDAVRVNRPKMEQLTLLASGHLERKCAEVRDS
ncbi:hypothetical protein KI387_022078, partial [Taxus chinensis]